MKKKIVFLDRDGVINDGTAYYTYTPESFMLNKGVGESLKLLQLHGFEFIVITNQSGVARGIYSLHDVERVHVTMKKMLASYGVSLLAIYVCPHHPEVSNCNCRKPKSGMFEQACLDFDIDIAHSYMIGDSQRDASAAEAMGIQSFIIEKNQNILPVCTHIISLLV